MIKLRDSQSFQQEHPIYWAALCTYGLNVCGDAVASGMARFIDQRLFAKYGRAVISLSVILFCPFAFFLCCTTPCTVHQFYEHQLRDRALCARHGMSWQLLWSSLANQGFQLNDVINFLKIDIIRIESCPGWMIL